MPVTKLEIFLIIIGPIILRPIILSNPRYMAACFFYAVMLVIGKWVFSSLDIKGEDDE